MAAVKCGCDLMSVIEHDGTPSGRAGGKEAKEIDEVVASFVTASDHGGAFKAKRLVLRNLGGVCLCFLRCPGAAA